MFLDGIVEVDLEVRDTACMDNNDQSKSFAKVSFITIDEASEGQRVDNFLLKTIKNIPRSYVYRILRKGEVRVDKKRVKPTRKLKFGEEVRIPPIKHIEQQEAVTASSRDLAKLSETILLEDQHIIIVNKSSGMAVHGGSGIRLGMIEMFRQLRPEAPFLELAHRLDRETSGLLILAKTRPALLELHDLFKAGEIDKRYLALVNGKWRGGERKITNVLSKAGKHQTGKVKVAEEGKVAESVFKPRERYGNTTLMEVKLLTGRMHQIRAQLAHLNLPIIGDDRYGDFAVNKHFKKVHGIKRLFLHSFSVTFFLETSQQQYALEIPLPNDLPLPV